MTGKEIGWIRSAAFGQGGYQDAQLGLSLDFMGDGWGVSDFIGYWDREPDKHCKWTKEDQDHGFAKAVRKLGETLALAGKQSVADLAGTPVEVEFENNTLKGWRVLTEVIPK